MRFHFGFSFRPKTLIKYILLGIMGVLAFLCIFNNVKADTLSYTSIQVNNSNNGVVLSCNHNSQQACPNTDINITTTEYIGRYFLFNFDSTTLTLNHNYTFEIEFVIVHDPSDTAFEQESFLIYQSGSNAALNETTIVWQDSTRYDWDYNRYYTSYTYSGQFTATSTSSFYTNLKMENNESFYGVGIGLVHLVDETSGDDLINANYQNTQNIINNANSNTQSILNNNNSNTQSIINNQNNNTQKEIDSQKVCNVISVFSIYNDNSSLLNNGGISYNYNVGVTDYINIKGASIKKLSAYTAEAYLNRYCFYDSDKTFISCSGDSSLSDIVIPNNAIYFRATISKTAKKPTYEICKTGNQALNDQLQDTNQSIQELNDTISDDTIDTTSSDSFFSNFNNNTHGLTGIVTLPLTTIQNLNNASCSPLSLTIPFISSNNSLQLPCLTPIYQSNFGNFFTLYQTIIFGFVSYYVCINIFRMVKDFKDPNKDKIEVMDL